MVCMQATLKMHLLNSRLRLPSVLGLLTLVILRLKLYLCISSLHPPYPLSTQGFSNPEKVPLAHNSPPSSEIQFNPTSVSFLNTLTYRGPLTHPLHSCVIY